MDHTAHPADDQTGLPEAFPSQPVRYIDRTRAWYGALGYEPYRWPHVDDVGFTPLAKPLHESRLTLVTTAAPYRPELGDQGPGAAYNGAAKFFEVYSAPFDDPPDVRISHIGYDRANTTAEDPNTWFPVPRLQEAVAAERLGGLTASLHGAPTVRSVRQTTDEHAPEIVRRCLAEDTDVALLVPNCPVCHQTVTLVAQQLEAAGVPTVVLGAAKDIVEHVGAPRFAFSDVPLGNSAGLPGDIESQRTALECALRLLESAPGARTTWQTPLVWGDGDHRWKRAMMNLSDLDAGAAESERSSFEHQKQRARLANA